MQAQELRDAGKEPYAYNFERTHMAAALHEQFTSLENGHEAELEVSSYRPWYMKILLMDKALRLICMPSLDMMHDARHECLHATR